MDCCKYQGLLIVLLQVEIAVRAVKVSFYRHLLHNCDILLCNVFLMFFSDSFKTDCVLRTSFVSKADAVKSVW